MNYAVSAPYIPNNDQRAIDCYTKAIDLCKYAIRFYMLPTSDGTPSISHSHPILIMGSQATPIPNEIIHTHIGDNFMVSFANDISGDGFTATIGSTRESVKDIASMFLDLVGLIAHMIYFAEIPMEGEKHISGRHRLLLTSKEGPVFTTNAKYADYTLHTISEKMTSGEQLSDDIAEALRLYYKTFHIMPRYARANAYLDLSPFLDGSYAPVPLDIAQWFTCGNLVIPSIETQELFLGLDLEQLQNLDKLNQTLTELWFSLPLRKLSVKNSSENQPYSMPLESLEKQLSEIGYPEYVRAILSGVPIEDVLA